MTALVIRGDAGRLPLADNSVDLIVTSPPYYALRSYTDGGQHYDGQLGSEPSPREYVAALVAATAEWARVLKPTGSMWVNLGDKYAERAGPARDGGIDGHLINHRAARPPRRGSDAHGMRPKSLMMLPERYRIAAVDDLGLIARQVQVWSKPNPMPESVTDRTRRTHEDWVHLVKRPTYFSAIDEVREDYAPDTASRYAAGYADRPYDDQRLTVRTKLGSDVREENPLGKMPGSVWSIPTEPLRVPAYRVVGAGLQWIYDPDAAWSWVRHHGAAACAVPRDDTRVELRTAPDHFAAFPTEWPRRLILGWSPSGICTACGQGRRPVITGYVCACTPYTDHPERRRPTLTGGGPGYARDGDAVQAARAAAGLAAAHRDGWPVREPVRDWHLDQWTPAPTRPAVVLDPFGGTGTTAMVADTLGRTGITVDLSADYCALAHWRTRHPTGRAKVRRRTHADRQGDLFGAAL